MSLCFHLGFRKYPHCSLKFDKTLPPRESWISNLLCWEMKQTKVSNVCLNLSTEISKNEYQTQCTNNDNRQDIVDNGFVKRSNTLWETACRLSLFQWNCGLVFVCYSYNIDIFHTIMMVKGSDFRSKWPVCFSFFRIAMVVYSFMISGEIIARGKWNWVNDWGNSVTKKEMKNKKG